MKNRNAFLRVKGFLSLLFSFLRLPMFKEINKIIYPLTRKRSTAAAKNIFLKYSLTEKELDELLRDYVLFLREELLQPAYAVYRLPLGDLIISSLSASTFVSFLNTRSRALFVRYYKNRDKPLIVMRVNREIATTLSKALFRLRRFFPKTSLKGIIEDE